jgi:Xaa-Pro aminopeptidase
LTGDRRRCHGAVVTHPLSGRHARVAEAITAGGVDALVVVNSSNIRYLTGFAGTAGVLVVTAGCLYLLVDFRYSSAVARLVRDGIAPPALVPVSLEGSAGYDRRLAELVTAEGWTRVGFEDAHVSVQRARQWGELFAAAGAKAALVGVTDAVERPRLVKDASEIETLREAGRLLSAVTVDVLDSVIRAGRTELEMAADIDWRVKRAGFEKPAFETIVASGPNSALPHARPTDRRAESGDLVVVDFGGMLRGYAVDLTRTVGLGTVSDESRRIYEAVLEAQQAAIDAAGRPEVTTGEVDAAARDTLARHGLDGVFGHGTGHGLGLDVHEAPRLSRRSAEVPGTDRLEAGMVFTIEPGAYVEGTGGVRIEDDVVRLEGGCALLTDVPRAWRVIPA